MAFKNREEAARRLAARLILYRGQKPLVLGIPRGAVPMAGIIADVLDGDVDVVLVRKLGAPGQPELAIGAIDEAGTLYLSDYVREFEIGAAEIARETQSQMAILRKRRALYTPLRPPIDPSGRVVIVVDDGVATGATMLAAVKAVRTKKPKKLIAAAAVASREAARRIEPEVDSAVFLHVPHYFYAVGRFFDRFEQVSDREVMEVLARRGPRGKAAGIAS